MTEHRHPTGPPRDVPPPRPVSGPAAGSSSWTGAPADGAGLGPAARALADAVAGLLGREPGAGGARPSRGGRATATVLADVVSAVAAAARSARSPEGAADRTGRSGAGLGAGRAGRWAPGGLLSDLLDAAAPALPIRDRARLQAAHPGATEQEIADALVARATRLTGAVGAATGGLAAAQWLAPPSLVAVPLEMGAQTVLVAAVEVVLVGELHELYRRPAPGDARERAMAYLSSWTTQRAVGTPSSRGMFSRLGQAGAQALRRRLTRRLAGSATSFAPLLVGATLSARSNKKATATLAERVLADLRTELPSSPTRGARP